MSLPIIRERRRRLRNGNLGRVVGGFLVAVVLPALIRWPDTTLKFASDSLHNALLATTAALLIGFFITRKLTLFPGIQAFSFILPAFAASYGLIAAALLLTRNEYSRYQLLTSFLAALLFFHWAYFQRSGEARLRLGLLPCGNTQFLLENKIVDWIVWSSPERVPDGLDGIVADLRADLGEEWESFLARCALQSLPVYHAKHVHESLTGRVAIEHMSENNLGSLIPSSLYANLKLALDVLVALLIVPLAIPLCMVAGILIRLDSPGPIFFIQPRVGYRGAVFSIVKLRTMSVGSARDGQPEFTRTHDPRVTRVGKVLRRHRIDELPQIINILKGQMSWIGPRPESLPLSAWYDRQIPFYSYRHIVRPGITGWAQVQQGYAAEIDSVTGKLHYDFFYIKHFSPWLDLLIIMRTFRTVLIGFGAR